jgi:hypothetical protein
MWLYDFIRNNTFLWKDKNVFYFVRDYLLKTSITHFFVKVSVSLKSNELALLMESRLSFNISTTGYILLLFLDFKLPDYFLVGGEFIRSLGEAG